MSGSFFGLRQSLGGAAAIGRLPEDAAIAVPIGLEHDPLAVWGPDRKSVDAAKGEALYRRAAAELVDEHVAVFTGLGSKRHMAAVRRHPRMDVRPTLQLQSFERTVAIDQREILRPR